MKKYQLKILIFFIIFILIIYTIYHLFFSQPNKSQEIEAVTAKEKVISNNLRIGMVEFDTINPILSNNRNVQEVSRLIFEPLISLTEDFRLQPGLAKEWTQLDDVTYLIKLNEKVTWQDGNKFDSQDVIFTINMIQKKGNQSIYSYNVEDIKKVEKIDEYTIKITTKEKVPYFEYNLIFPILSSKYFSSDNFESEEKNKNPAGTGMYYIAETNSDSIVLKRNLDWSERNEIELKLDYIKLNLYENINQSLADFKNQNVDILTSSNLNIEDYLESTQYNKIELINRNYFYLTFNCNHEALKNVEVRQAISQSIDKEKINQEVYSGKYKVSNFPIDFGSYLYEGVNKRQENTIEAKKILEQANWNDSQGTWKKKVNSKYITLEFDLLVNQDEEKEVETAENIQRQLEEIGIKITINKVKEKEYKRYLETGKYEIAIASKTFSYSPSLYGCLGEDNLSQYQNKEINQKLEELGNTNDETKEKEMIEEIIEIYNQEVPFTSLYYDTLTIIYSPHLKGEMTPTSYSLFYHIENWYREYDKT